MRVPKSKEINNYCPMRSRMSGFFLCSGMSARRLFIELEQAPSSKLNRYHSPFSFEWNSSGDDDIPSPNMDSGTSHLVCDQNLHETRCGFEGALLELFYAKCYFSRLQKNKSVANVNITNRRICSFITPS